MRKLLLLALIAALLPASVVFAADIGHFVWNQSNLETLRSFDKDAVVRSINEWSGSKSTPGDQKWLREFEWVDLAGDGKYELATTSSFGPCCVFLTIYTQDSPGRVSTQSFDGAGKLSDTIRDFNGDGKKELILAKDVVDNGGGLKFSWPAVYRLEDGKYAEASRDFPKFYDDEVLPNLDKHMAEYKQKAKRGHWPEKEDTKPFIGTQDVLAGMTMERNKILRELGRNPTAGIEQAYQWMNSDDPHLLQDAEVTFGEIGGHQGEARMAHQAWERAYCVRNPRMAMCKNVALRPLPAAQEPAMESHSEGGLTPPASAQQSGGGPTVPESAASSGAPPAQGTVVHKGGSIP